MLRRLIIATGLFALAAASARSSAQSATSTLQAAAAVAKEQALWGMLKKNDFKGFDAVVGGMMYAGATGVVPEWKPGLAEAFFKGCVLKSFAIDSMQTRTHGPDLVVLSYKATTDWRCGANRMPSPTYETAVWQRRGDRWVALYGGSTPVAGK